MAALEVENLHTSSGNIHALKGVSLSVSDGEIVTLIGANGAGKTTTLKTISGILRPRSGSVRLDGQPVPLLEPHRIVRLGLSQSPEGRRIFRRMTVLENLEMGAFARNDPRAIDEDIERVFQLFPRLKKRQLSK